MFSRLLLRTVMLSLVALLAATASLHAQSAPAPSGSLQVAPPSVKVGNAELKRFAGALKDVQTVQVDFQKSFRKAVKESSLSRADLTKIYQSELSTHKLPPDLSANKRRQYQTLVSHVVQLEQKTKTEMIAAVEKDGFTVARFDSIVQAMRSDPSLAKRLAKLGK